MSIKGLTDNVAPRFPRLGKIKKGAPKPEQGNKPGQDLEYFRFDGEPDAARAFSAAYGQQPAVLTVYLPYATPDECFQSWKEKWSAGGLVHRCDGQTMQIWRTPAGAYAREPKACDGGCDEVGRLEVILPELIRAGHVGYVTLETHGLNDMLGIQATLNAAYTARRDLRGIEFVLRRVEREISTPGQNGQRVRRPKWIVELTPAPRWAQVQLAMAQSAALALPEPAEAVDTVTGEIVEPAAQASAPAPAKAAAPAPAPASQPAAQNGSGKPPSPPPAAANGQAKRVVYNRAKVEERWSQLWGVARDLGMTVEAAPGGISTDDLVKRGQELGAAIYKRAHEIVNTHPAGKINLDDTDEQVLEQALRLVHVPAEAQP